MALVFKKTYLIMVKRDKYESQVSALSAVC